MTPAESPEWRRKRRTRRDSDSDTSVKALEDLQLWQEQEEHLPEVLPPEVLGWLLLRRSNLSHQERLSVQAAASNSLRMDDVEKALRSMEDELVHADEGRSGPRRDPRRRTYWVEEDGQWSLLVGDPSELDELVEAGSAMYVGDRLPPQVYQDPELAWYQQHADEWQPGGDENGWWGESGWNETTWWTDPHEHEELSPEEQKEVDEAFAAAEQKVRGFVQARQAIKARNLSRGFYSYNPSAKGGAFKGKGKGKSKGKGPGKSKAPSPSSPTTFAHTEDPGGFLGAAVGDPYSGCFICGDKSHDFRSCPKRATARSGKGSRGGQVHFVDAQVFTVSLADVSDRREPACDIAFENLPDRVEKVFAIEEIGTKGEDSAIYQNDLSNPNVVPDTELSGFAVIDSGATETVASLPALEALMGLRHREKGYAEPVIVTDVPAKRFKFGNGEHAFSSSYILLPQTVGDQAVQLGVFTMDVTGVPLLLGIKSLRRLQAVLDFDRCVAVFAAVDPGLAIHLKRSRSGHMLIDLKGDWLAEGTRLDSLPQPISTPCSAEENYVATAFVVVGALGKVPDNGPDPCQSDERVPVSESRVLSAHVRAEPRSPEPDCSPSSCKDTLMPVLKSDGPRDSMKPLGAFLTLVAQHGFRNFDYSERMPRSTIYDGLRDPDGESHKKEAGHGGSLGRSPGRGSRSPRPSLPRTPLQWSSRARSSWKGVTFGLESARQLDSVPPLQDSAVLHASCRGACSLPQGGTSEQRCQGGPSGVRKPRTSRWTGR